MAGKLIVRIHPDERVEVRVEGLTDRDKTRPKREKVCEKVTQRLEQDLGIVIQRTYFDDGLREAAPELTLPDDLQLGGG